MSAYSSYIGSELGAILRTYGRDHDLGRAFSEILLRLPLEQDRQRRPDVAFVSFKRWPKDRPMPEEDNAWPLVPELAVEVISPTDRVEEIFEKIDEYFRAGVRLVWVVFPRHRTVWVYNEPGRMRAVLSDGILEGGDVLPGFRLALSDLFQPRQE